VQRVHLTPDFVPDFLVAGSYFGTNAIDSCRCLVLNGRKFSAHVVPELQNVRLECRHASGQELKTFHFSFENLDSTDHNLSPACRGSTPLDVPRACRLDDGSIVKATAQTKTGS